MNLELFVTEFSTCYNGPTTLEVDEGKENARFKQAKDCVAVTEECFSWDRYISSTIGKACLQHYVSERIFLK
jgi:hypothetical protein